MLAGMTGNMLSMEPGSDDEGDGHTPLSLPQPSRVPQHAGPSRHTGTGGAADDAEKVFFPYVFGPLLSNLCSL